MAVNERQAVGYRIRSLRERRGWDRDELARRLGVHTGSIARWETGGAVPHPYTLERIADLLGTPAEFIRTGRNVPLGTDGSYGEFGAAEEVDPPPGGVAADAEAEAEDVLFSLDRVARFLDGIGPAGQERLRKLDALEGLRRMLTARGALPGWWYALHERVEKGEA